MSERSTHFAGFAKLLVPELDRLYMTLHARISELRPIEEIDEIEDEIRTLVARRAYDLVYASCEAIDDKQSDYEARITLEAMIDNAPDLTTWPTHKELPHG